MPLDLSKVRKLLTACEFKQLFIEELGWNHHNIRLEIPVDGQNVTLSAIAEKCGMAAFICQESNGKSLTSPMRRKIERLVAKSAHEHLIIFTDKKQTRQIWQWVRREQGKPTACREHTYHVGQPGDSLIQKLQSLAVSLEEEENLTLPDVTGRARKAFDVERVTKKFYDRFKTEHTSFLKFLEGVPDKELERWYVSVMLNRLMFIYFIQKKGFLNNDRDYLKNKLVQCKKELGKDRYYRDFLCPLFFEGFAKQKGERSDKANKLLGEVPYLNGGIFMPHQIEQLHGKTIAIPDKAFEKLFEFFDAYQWHLDERPLRKDDEINPDVLGYIFEKYINQKQMGAYYTKEDITEYISKNTVIPFLFDVTREKCKVSFEGKRSIWQLLQEDPDRYIYPAVKHGVELTLPPDITAGIGNVSKRDGWNKPAPAEYALPTEIWREVVVRRKRYEEVKGKLTAGEVRSINDLITYNLDIRQFAQDVIENCEGPELLMAFWKAIEKVTVLDPTCGSGAFLFAALNILDPLYEACLERMRFFLEEWGEDGKKNHPNYHKLFSETLKYVDEHPNHRYFILKSIIVNNLYGVDIMEEAVEICKLRLFLKLVAQIERVEDIEPLPDIDFNIRSGNTLVGLTSLDALRDTMTFAEGGQRRMLYPEEQEALERIEEDAEIADRAFRKFHEMQTKQGMPPKDFAEAKDDLRSRLKKLTDQLDRFLSTEYGVDTKKKDAFEKWRSSHRPFHWFVEFYGILNAGGFDMVIGNPPYVEYDKKLQAQYRVNGYSTLPCSNLHAFVAERSFSLIERFGRVGLIVPLPSINTSRMESLQHLIKPQIERGRSAWVSAFDERPSNLFSGVDQRLVIEIIGPLCDSPCLHTTGISRWQSACRDVLFPLLVFAVQPTAVRRLTNTILKIKQADIEATMLLAFYANAPIEAYKSSTPTGQLVAYRTAGGRYWKIALDRPFDSESLSNKTAFLRGLTGRQAAALLMSSTFWWYYSTHFDMYNLKDYMIFGFRFSDPSQHTLDELEHLGANLQRSLRQNSVVQTIQSKTRGEVTSRLYVGSRSKPVIDEIDEVLARHYGFSREQLDFIIDYDIKYRMGQDTEEEGDE